MRFFYFIIISYIFVELICTTLYIVEFGAWMFFLEFVMTSLLSMLIMFWIRGDILEGLRKFNKGQISLSDFVGGNFARVVGAFLLLFPGIFADFLGIILEIYAFFVLKVFKKNLQNTSKRENSFDNFERSSWSYRNFSNEEIIDVEIIQEPKNLK
ncbi:FxsA family protein [Helicobacter cappadocius]|uniref:FxsA family protein n=1 Tax=Helicobacter cappadocius TaxID=3063998 RepID=A0AA90PST5_9HELI|nr:MULTISPECIES: FxsA family protein [unclassified Helicobacter]MDO7253589.1 FxsA family protein [Helicobacter sp. faydin-H75]MDP2539517.1 FxsA family protein [Helicobacter sp. faydin-H76]